MDVFLSRKTRKNNRNKFGFVRFSSIEEAKKVAERMNGIVIKDCKIQVNMARYERRTGKLLHKKEVGSTKGKKDIHSFLAVRDGRSYKEVLVIETTNATKKT